MASSGDAEKGRAWETRFARYRASGLSVARFCKQERVSTNTFYYWVKRLGAVPVPSRADQALPPGRASAALTTDGNAWGAMVRFRWETGAEVLIPADCLEAIRCLAQCLVQAGDGCGGAFHEVVVKA